MTVKKVIAGSLSMLLIAVLLPGCNVGKTDKDGGDEIKISIDNWPDDTHPDQVKVLDTFVKKMNDAYPNIKIIPSIGGFDVQTFMVKASSNQLPTLYTTPYTEINHIIDSKYAADLTEALHTYGYDTALNPDLLKLGLKDGKYYIIPENSYAQGLMLNRNLFVQAGLTNADGTLKIPDTYDELAKTAQIIKQKTGKAGFIMPTMNNYGGWHFMNIAWSFGVQFEKKVDNKWTASFNTPECVAALQFIKDLKWKYGALPENAFIDKEGMMKLFATDQGAMFIGDPPMSGLIDYGMKKDAIAAGRMPAGPGGRYTQMGGNVRLVAANATKQQIDAAFKWLDIVGLSPKVDQATIDAAEAGYKQQNEKGQIVLDQEPFKQWVNMDKVNVQNKARSKYVNVNPKNFESYFSFKDVVIKPEEPISCQQMYNMFDAAIQLVITDQTADPKNIIEKTAKDFQTNYLDKAER